MTTTTAPRRKVSKKKPSPRARAATPPKAPAVDLPPHPTRGKKLPAEVLDDAELDALLRACSARAPSGIRDRALIMFLAKSGLRISEALDLRVGDVDRKTGTVRVLHGKGDKARVCGVAESALVMLDRWLEVRAEIGAKRAAPLFCAISAGKVGNRLDTSSVRHMLRRRAARAGIEKRVHPHGLRHKLASDLVAKRVPLNSVQALLGHTHITTTARYVARINPTHAIEALRDALD